jgi:hypothetical protein
LRGFPPEYLVITAIGVIRPEHCKGGKEDDPDGQWNYEVFVKTNGKDSGFEVDSLDTGTRIHAFTSDDLRKFGSPPSSSQTIINFAMEVFVRLLNLG